MSRILTIEGDSDIIGDVDICESVEMHFSTDEIMRKYKNPELIIHNKTELLCDLAKLMEALDEMSSLMGRYIRSHNHYKHLLKNKLEGEYIISAREKQNREYESGLEDYNRGRIKTKPKLPTDKIMSAEAEFAASKDRMSLSDAQSNYEAAQYKWDSLIESINVIKVIIKQMHETDYHGAGSR